MLAYERDVLVRTLPQSRIAVTASSLEIVAILETQSWEYFRVLVMSERVLMIIRYSKARNVRRKFKIS